MSYDREKQKGNANRATLAVARKLAAYLMAVDRRQCHFLVIVLGEERRCKILGFVSAPCWPLGRGYYLR
jgi:hypothetical protein